MRSLPMCAAWLIFTGVSVVLQSNRHESIGNSRPYVPHAIRNAGFHRRGSRRAREPKIDQFSKAVNPRFSLSRLVAHAHQMRRHRPDKFAAEGRGSRAKEHRRATAGEFPKPRGAAAVFSVRQKSGPIDHHMPLTSGAPPRLPLAGKDAYPAAPARWRELRWDSLEHINVARFPVARTIPSERKSRQGERHVSCFSRARRACRRVAGVGL